MHFAKYLALCPSKRSENLHPKSPRVSRKYAAKTKVNGQKAEKILKENLQNRSKLLDGSKTFKRDIHSSLYAACEHVDLHVDLQLAHH